MPRMNSFRIHLARLSLGAVRPISKRRLSLGIITPSEYCSLVLRRIVRSKTIHVSIYNQAAERLAKRCSAKAEQTFASVRANPWMTSFISGMGRHIFYSTSGTCGEAEYRRLPFSNLISKETFNYKPATSIDELQEDALRLAGGWMRCGTDRYGNARYFRSGKAAPFRHISFCRCCERLIKGSTKVICRRCEYRSARLAELYTNSVACRRLIGSIKEELRNGKDQEHRRAA